jgi:hypothetical protein
VHGVGKEHRSRPFVEAVTRSASCAPAACLASLLQPSSTSPASVLHTYQMSEPVPESKPANVSELKPASVPEPAEDPWRVAFVEFEKRDTKMVADYREEIDTLLVFVRRRHRVCIPELTTLTSQAGLFSAVLTAFVVESYQSLQEDYTKTSVDLLRQISSQLANSSFPAAPNPSPFQAQRSDVRVNVCWFVSLLLSLVVALFGIFLKQWMRAYMKWTDVTPDREAVAIRQLRYRSLETWRLAAILALLPTLLQLSVILFLSGLLIFLSNLDRKVAHVKAVLLVITFFLVATVSILPAISRSCRFRSPLSEIIAVTFWRALDYALMSLLVIFVFILSGFRYSPNSDGGLWIQVANWWHVHPKIASWVQADERVVARYNKREDDVTISMHVGAMVRLFCTTQSQQLWSVVLTAIMAECPADNFIHMDPMKQRIYFDQVWWPVLGHVSMRKSDACRLNPDDPRTVTVEFECLSSSMKDCWVSFLLHIKDLVCVARSAGVAEFYMISCLATIESTGGPQCMQAFMDVLGAQYANFNEPHLDSIMYCLEHKYSRTAPLLDWLSGLSSPGRTVS